MLIVWPQAAVPLPPGKLSPVITAKDVRFARELVWNFYERNITARDENGDHIIRLHTPYTSRVENYLLDAFKKYKIYNFLKVLLYEVHRQIWKKLVVVAHGSKQAFTSK
jgi:hypothetical protein